MTTHPAESYLSSPDTPSTMFPDRLIRPLPKRSLRSRLSQEAQEAIPYPPSVPITTLPSYTRYGENGEYLTENNTHVQHGGSECYHDHDHTHDHDHHCNHGRDHVETHYHEHHDDDVDDQDSAEDSSPIIHRRTNGYRHSPVSPRASRHGRHFSKSSGPDGYDAFENTNNKKKRKIPTSNTLGLHASLSNEMSQLELNGSRDGITVAADSTSGIGQHYASTSTGSPVGNTALRGGSVRGSGRRLSNRNPLGVSINGANTQAGLAAVSGLDFEGKLALFACLCLADHF